VSLPITNHSHLFRRGEVVVHRDLFGGRIWYARAEIIVEDSVNGPLLTYWGPGAEVRAPVDTVDGRPLRIPIAHWVLEPRPWHSTHVLSCSRPGDAYSVWLFWETESWRFTGWYINMQSPFVRTQIGFDAADNILDVWIEPGGTSWWKDDHELEEAVRAGAFKAEAAGAIRREATEAVAGIRGREPFTEAWTRWRSEGAWPVPALKPDWESVPPSSLMSVHDGSDA
jgi:hypothetical protein